MSVREKMTAIADAIRAKTGHTEKLDLDAIAAGVEQVYEAGGQAQQKRFWDVLQQKGNRDFYDRAFESVYWSDENFEPVYPLICTGSNGCRQMFSGNTLLTTVKVPIYARNTRLTHTFNGCTNLKTLPLLFVENVTEYTNAFNQCKELENITIGGSIEKNISFEHSTKLTRESIESIVAALSDTVTGQVLTLSKTAVDIAFFDSDNEWNGSDSVQWGQLCDSKPNWTITLV